jgi:hypothetical protein
MQSGVIATVVPPLNFETGLGRRFPRRLRQPHEGDL